MPRSFGGRPHTHRRRRRRRQQAAQVAAAARRCKRGASIRCNFRTHQRHFAILSIVLSRKWKKITEWRHVIKDLALFKRLFQTLIACFWLNEL